MNELLYLRKLNDRSLQLHEAHKRIIALEKEIVEQTEEVKPLMNP